MADWGAVLLQRVGQDAIELTHVVQEKVFLEYHGVPAMVALDAIDISSTTTSPASKVVSSWPPDLPVFWLTHAERDSWDQRTGLPESVQNATGIQHGSLLYLDGQLHRAAVSDNKPGREPLTTKFFPHDRTGKFMALAKQ